MSFYPYSIWQIKNRLRHLMRGKGNKYFNWPAEIEKVVQGLNNTRTVKHSFKPIDVAKPIDDVKVRKELIKRKKMDEPKTLEELMNNQSKYLKSNQKTRFYPGDIVQINTHVHKMDKKTVHEVEFFNFFDVQILMIAFFLSFRKQSITWLMRLWLKFSLNCLRSGKLAKKSI